MVAVISCANIKQLSAILALGCSKGGFPTLNRHLYIDELAGLGWRDLQPLRDDPARGQEALTASVYTLVWSPSRVQSMPTCSLGIKCIGVTVYMSMPWS